LARRHHDTDDGKRTGLGAVHKMRLHREILAADQMIARPEVKLHRL